MEVFCYKFIKLLRGLRNCGFKTWLPVLCGLLQSKTRVSAIRRYRIHFVWLHLFLFGDKDLPIFSLTRLSSIRLFLWLGRPSCRAGTGLCGFLAQLILAHASFHLGGFRRKIRRVFPSLFHGSFAS